MLPVLLLTSLVRLLPAANPCCACLPPTIPYNAAETVYGLPSILLLKPLVPLLPATHTLLRLPSTYALQCICSGDGVWAAIHPAAHTFHAPAACLPPTTSCNASAAEIAYGLLSILLFTPLLGLLVAQLPLNPRPLALGLGLVCTVPTALACGVAFVQVGRIELGFAADLPHVRWAWSWCVPYLLPWHAWWPLCR